MSDESTRPTLTRREMLGTMGAIAAGTVVATSLVEAAFGESGVLAAQATPVNALAGVDRVVMLKGKTYLRSWVGYGQPPRSGRAGGGGRGAAAPEPVPTGPAPTAAWSKVSGPGAVTFADPSAAVTTATFSQPGDYVLKVVANNGSAHAESTLSVKVELPPPPTQLEPVVTRLHAITSPFWASRTKALIVNWIPHCIDQMNRTDIPAGRGDGGIDNFVEAAKAHRGEPYAAHKGYVFSNAWVHQTVEAMSLALMVDPMGDEEIIAAQTTFRATLEDWIPKILAAREPSGYLQTAFTLRDAPRPTPPPGANSGRPIDPNAPPRPKWTGPWQPAFRGNHEGYTAGYFIESAINHFVMSNQKDHRLYDAAKKLADCWADHIGPAPKQEWFDGHQEMEQALVRFGRFVNEVEGHGSGDRYIGLAKFLLDSRKNGSEYDQSHLPVVQQYEAVGHAVRAVYTYSGMADVAVETHDVDYQSAVKSLWDNIVHKKYYLTGGVGSGETSEGFGANYSLRNNSYCETCSSCGEVFFQWKMHLAYHDAQFADLYEQTMYNALIGGLDLAGQHMYYANPLDANADRPVWQTCPCCVGNISRTVLMLPTWMYSKGQDAIYVNLFAGSRVTIDGIAGTNVQMLQTTDYPWKGNVSIVVNPAAEKQFAIKVRMPKRDVSSLYSATPAADGVTSLAVNGIAVKPEIENGYAVLKRRWRAGDRIEFTLPMVPQRIRASAKIDATQKKVALRYGPLVYNIEKVDQDITNVLDPSSKLAVEWRETLLGGVNVITGTFADGALMTAIPNYARCNRNPPAPPRPADPPADPAAPRPAPPPPPPPNSIVWIHEE